MKTVKEVLIRMREIVAEAYVKEKLFWHDDLVNRFGNSYSFKGLCALISAIDICYDDEGESLTYLVREVSDLMYGHKPSIMMSNNVYWFTIIEEDETKARQERLDFLDMLIAKQK